MDKQSMEKTKKIFGETGFPFRHSLPLQIRFNDIDALNHVNNSVYFNFFDLGKAKYFEAVKEGNIEWEKVNIVVANINCDFMAPIFFNENIAVQTQTLTIGNTSFKVFQRLINIDTQEVKCCCTTIMVGYDVEIQCAASLDKDWIEGMTKYEQRDLRIKK